MICTTLGTNRSDFEILLRKLNEEGRPYSFVVGEIDSDYTEMILQADALPNLDLRIHLYPDGRWSPFVNVVEDAS